MVQMVETKAEFDAIVAGDKLVVVDFTATWCGPCQMIGPKFAAMADEFPDVQFVKVDVDENDETAAACGIEAMPTFHYYKGGQKVDELVGADINALKAKVNALK
ncbi:hypothetical protein TeGR_g11790 [Tetraparma gracilis]|jgi:thioredoxin|uniref:Thioredoxin n=1 Tax=Tetraparma gracilis TaxID=2962635 RepID=A0ABQ6NBY6_9STRA|nr:hypothetical protein TeGR_g11790 [Tetraparma gracilis]